MKERVKIRQRGKRPLQLYYVERRTGRERTRSAGTYDRIEAERAAAVWEHELAAGWAGAADMCWDKFRIRFEDEYLPKLSAGAQSNYRTALRHFEAVVGHPRHIAEIDATVMSGLRSGLTDRLEAATADTVLRCIRAALRWAQSLGWIEAAPTVKSIGRQSKYRFARSRPISEAELELLMHTADTVYPDNSHEWRRLLAVLWHSGLRAGEVWLLSWDEPPLQLDLSGGRYPQLIFWAVSHKSREDQRLPLTPEFAAYLASIPESERMGPVAPIHERGARLAAGTVEKRFAKLGRASGIRTGYAHGREAGKFVSAHDLRRSFGTRLASRVLPIVLQKLMRHRSIETTLRYYVTQTADELGAALWGAVAPRDGNRDGNREAAPPAKDGTDRCTEKRGRDSQRRPRISRNTRKKRE